MITAGIVGFVVAAGMGLDPELRYWAMAAGVLSFGLLLWGVNAL